MLRPEKEEIVFIASIRKNIFFMRGMRVMVSTHLADLYGIEHRIFVQTFKRNRDRFPASHVFQLNTGEFSILKSQFVISKYNYIRRSLPYAFSERGIVVLSGVISGSERSAAVNVALIHAFIRPYRPYMKTYPAYPPALC